MSSQLDFLVSFVAPEGIEPLKEGEVWGGEKAIGQK